MKPHPKQDRFHTDFIPSSKDKLVSYPVSYPVNAVWFHTRCHTSRITKALKPMESQRPSKDICTIPAQRALVWFHTGFISGFIPEPCRPNPSPIWLLCRPPVSHHGLIPWARGVRFQTPVSYQFHTRGFIPIFTGFIPYPEAAGFIPPKIRPRTHTYIYVYMYRDRENQHSLSLYIHICICIQNQGFG